MVSKMYKEMYSRWLAANLDDPDLKPELESIQNDDAAIQDRFAVALKFGTAGLRGVIGAGTNRMNVYVVRQATQGLANWVKTQGGSQTVAISYDSRNKSRCVCQGCCRSSGRQRRKGAHLQRPDAGSRTELCYPVL